MNQRSVWEASQRGGSILRGLADCTRPGLQAAHSRCFPAWTATDDNVWRRRREETKRQHLLRRLHHDWEVEGHKQQSCLHSVFHLHTRLEGKAAVCFVVRRSLGRQLTFYQKDQMDSFAAPVTRSLSRKHTRLPCRRE